MVCYSTSCYSLIHLLRSPRVPQSTRGTRDSIMNDVEPKTDEESPYECFECGTIVVTETHPMTCPDCNASMRNRQTPIE
ncbi:rubrerythrin-like domain-containing protein [Haloferax larsenii]|uniref:rubrerythrin-like domain-containing protein n=1 Tax=Haloferax larsenii TaxID=302484 RepID=UPI00373FDA3D